MIKKIEKTTTQRIDLLFRAYLVHYKVDKIVFECFISKQVDLKSEQFLDSFCACLMIQSNECIEYLIEISKIEVNKWKYIDNYTQNPKLDLNMLKKMLEGKKMDDQKFFIMLNVKI